MVAGAALTPERLGPILAPFEDPDGGFAIAVEDPDGVVLASAGQAPPDAPVDAVEEIRCGPGKAMVGRVVGRGSGPLVGPIVASLAASLAELAGSAHEHHPGGTAAHRLEAELALSRRIQRSLIPLTPPDLRGFEVATHYEAAREVGGDFFDVFPLRDRAGRAGIVIADVTGKGIAAALLMAFARPLVRSALDQARDPVVAIERTNKILVEERRSALFITALAGILDLRTRVLRLANAGHEPPLVVPGDPARPVRWLTGSGPLLGAFPTLGLGPCEVQLAPGDLVLLYTDGVTDTRAASGERFGDDRLLAVVEAARAGSARDMLDAVVAATHAFQGDEPSADDVTIVAVKREAHTRRDLARPKG
ncbi:MAG TPA: PP2C family protein-serine/threonine phosphatase [Candidatus Limnocylindrales bacterium]|nr:PP2C family protein-serine/threonine phosphatase [Candidatus Limnocylindrales bacterium]